MQIERAPINLLNAGNCSMTLLKMGRLGCNNEKLVNRVLACVEPLKLKPEQLKDCIVGIGFAKLCDVLPDAMVDKTLACRDFTGFGGEDFALLLESLAAESPKSLQVCYKVAEEICKRKNVKDFESNHLASIVHNFANKFTLRDHAEFFAYVARDIVKRKSLNDFESDDLALILQTYVSLPERDVALFDKICKFLCKYPETFDKFEPIDFVIVLQSFDEVKELVGDLPRLHAKISKHFCTSAQRKDLGNFSSYDIAVLLDLVLEYELVERMSAEIIARGEEEEQYEVEEIASILRSLARFEEHNKDTVQVLFDSLVKRDLKEVDEKYLESIHDSLEELGFPVDQVFGS